MGFDDTAVHDSDIDTANNEASGSASTDSEETDSGTADSEETDSGTADSEESSSSSTDSEKSDSVPTDDKEADSVSTDNKEADSVSTDTENPDTDEVLEGIVLSDASGVSEYTDTTVTCLTFGVFFLIGLFLARMTWGYLK